MFQVACPSASVSIRNLTTKSIPTAEWHQNTNAGYKKQKEKQLHLLNSQGNKETFL